MINLYIYYSSADSLDHSFIDYRESVKLYLFSHCHGTAITCTIELKTNAFHDIHHVTDVLSNSVRRKLYMYLLIILVKRYIYASRHLQKELSIDEFVEKVATLWELEKFT